MPVTGRKDDKSLDKSSKKRLFTCDTCNWMYQNDEMDDICSECGQKMLISETHLEREARRLELWGSSVM